MKIKSISVVETTISKNPHLSPNTEYAVIGIDDENYRIIDDKKEPILYPKYLFEIIDNTIPEDWVRTSYDDGEYFIDPPEFAYDFFYEKYFDGENQAVEDFKKYCVDNGIII